jgi:hypothetical protein
MLNAKLVKPFLTVYIGCLLLATFFLIPTITSFYYYAWGKHLAWSYFDGPPMIAYFFYISHAIFGNTFFSINIVGFFCLILGAYYIYKIGCLLQNQQTGFISTLIWLALPTTTESIFIRVLYDAPLNLFTILSFYYFARYILNKRIPDLYLSAFFIGAMILSKYTAAVTLVGLLLYIVFSEQRQLFKNIHFYFALTLILVMALPVIYWNVSHHWVSITYLLNFHSQAQKNATVPLFLWQLLLSLLVNYSIFLMLSVFGWLKYRQIKTKEVNPILEFTYALLFSGVVFWFVTTLLGGHARVVYLTPLGMNIALTAGYCIARYQYKRIFMLFYPLFLVFSITMIAVNSWPIATYLKKNRIYTVVRNAIQQPEIIKKGQPVVSGYYANAATLSFFMPNEPVYAIPCDDINQYQYWSKEFVQDLAQGKIDKISYVDFKNKKQCPERFFNKCESVATLSQHMIIPVIHKLAKPVYLYVYECSLPRASVIPNQRMTKVE